MNRLMYRPIRKIAAQRETQIAHSHTEVETIEEDNKSREEAYLDDLKKGRAQVRARLAELRDATEEEAMALIQDAHKKARAREDEIRSKVQQEVTQARRDISKEAQAVALRMASTILGREVS
jgi:F-type H+-transporting ATPase subunit b